MKFRLFNTFEPPGAPIFKDVLPYLAGQGHEINIYVSNLAYKKPSPIKKENKNNLKYNFIKTISFSNNNYLSKLSVMISYSISSIFKSLFSKKFDKNIFITQPPLFFFWGSVLQLIKREKYICIIMDVYPEVAIKSGVLRKNGFFARIFSEISKYSLNRADDVIVIGRCMKKRLEDMGVISEKISIITNWVDEKSIRPILHERNKFRKSHGLDNKIVIMYSGNMGIGHYFDDILKVAKGMQDYKDVVFLFIGDGMRKNEVVQFKNENNLENIKILPYQDHSILNQSIASADIHFVSLRDGFEGLMVPSKVYAILAAGRPILFQGPPSSEISYMINEYEIGLTVKPGDIESLNKCVLKMIKQDSLRRLYGKRAREVCEKYFNKKSRVEMYEKLLTK